MFDSAFAGTLINQVIQGNLGAILIASIPTIITVSAILYSVIITWRFARRTIR